jgi:hypothetical protein
MHRLHGLITSILFIVAMYFFYERELTGPPLTLAQFGETSGVVTVLILALFIVHEHIAM